MQPNTFKSPVGVVGTNHPEKEKNVESVEKRDSEIEFFLELEKKFQIRDHIVACIGSSRNQDSGERVQSFCEALEYKYPWAKVVSGEASPVERTATVMAAMLGLRTIIIPTISKKKGKVMKNLLEKDDIDNTTATPWNAGPEIRDERICSEATDVVLFDQSSRCKRFEKLAKRQSKKVWYL